MSIDSSVPDDLRNVSGFGLNLSYVYSSMYLEALLLTIKSNDAEQYNCFRRRPSVFPVPALASFYPGRVPLQGLHPQGNIWLIMPWLCRIIRDYS